MPYVRRTTIAGRTKEIELYYTAAYNKRGAKRAKKAKPTRDQQREVNRKAAERKLRLLLNANFGPNDYYITLDYIRKKGVPDRTRDEMKRDIGVFLRECRKQYRKAGKEFKYVHVMEIGKKGARHHHLVINRIDTAVICKAWKKAYPQRSWVNFKPLDDTGQYGDLAAYLIKYSDAHLKDPKGQRLQGKRWAASKNLLHPEPVYEIITNRAWFRSEVKVPAGWYEDKGRTEKGVSSPEYGGYGYFRYTLIKME